MYSCSQRLAYMLLDIAFKPMFKPDFDRVMYYLEGFTNMEGEELETAKKVATLLYEEWNKE